MLISNLQHLALWTHSHFYALSIFLVFLLQSFTLSYALIIIARTNSSLWTNMIISSSMLICPPVHPSNMFCINRCKRFLCLDRKNINMHTHTDKHTAQTGAESLDCQASRRQGQRMIFWHFGILALVLGYHGAQTDFLSPNVMALTLNPTKI